MTPSTQTGAPAAAVPRQTAHQRIKHYRPEVDGLRAVAILPVVLFHAGLGFPGGYVGVDIFFVISGYLITSLISKELETDTFSLVDFWARRARRIVPASLVLTLAVLAAGWFLLLPNDFRSLGRAAAAQAVFGSNFYFWSTLNYFASDLVHTAPLLHTWSLAVEEQFYVFFPLIFLACHRVAGRRRRVIVPALFVVGFVLSLACSVYGLRKSPYATFYLLPTRAWELLAGSILAVAPSGWTPLRRGVREALSVLGVAAIAFPVFRYGGSTPFPGLAALPPCLGSVLIIWSNGTETGPAPSGLTAVGRVLASPLPVFVGLISYSLYLWHWPLFAFSSYLAQGPLALGHRVTLVIVSLALAVLSWACVEGPFRKRQVFPSRPAVLAFAACGLVIMLTLGLVISRANGFSNRVSERVVALASAEDDHLPHPENVLHDILADQLMPFGVERPGAKPQIVVWGDSHAAVAVPAFDLYCKRHGIVGRAALHSSTAPLLGYHTYAASGLNDQAPAFAQAVFDYIQRNQVPRVFLVAFWHRDVLADPAGLEAGLIRTIEAFRATNTELFIVLQVPEPGINVPRALALDVVHPGQARDWRKRVDVHRRELEILYRLAAKYASPKCVFVDPAPWFEDADGQHYQVIRDGHPLYTDANHMTVFAATTIFEPFLERLLVKTPDPGQ